MKSSRSCTHQTNRRPKLTTTSSILFYGDPHGEFAPLTEAVETHRPAAVVLLGDLDLPAPLEGVLEPILGKTEVWFIHGNHDCDRKHWHDHLLGSALADRNLDGRVEEISGMRVAGLGGVFRGQIWDPRQGGPKWRTREHYLANQPSNVRRGGVPLKHRASIWWEDYAALWDQQADILVTHEAPSCHRYGFAALDDLAGALGVSRHYHGHHHVNYQADLPNGVLVHGVARAGIKDLAGSQIFTGLGRNGGRL